MLSSIDAIEARYPLVSLADERNYFLSLTESSYDLPEFRRKSLFIRILSGKAFSLCSG